MKTRKHPFPQSCSLTVQTPKSLADAIHIGKTKREKKCSLNETYFLVVKSVSLAELLQVQEPLKD